MENSGSVSVRGWGLSDEVDAGPVVIEMDLGLVVMMAVGSSSVGPGDAVVPSKSTLDTDRKQKG